MPRILSLHLDDYRAAARQAAHSHDALHFSVVLRGLVTETVGGVTEYASPLCVVAKDPGLVHANEWGIAGARLARLSLRDGTLADLMDDPGRVVGWRWTQDPRVARPFLRLVERRHHGESMFHRDDSDLLDLVAAFTARRTVDPSGIPPAWLRDVMESLHAEWHPQLTGADLASRARVHPVYLARCIRRWYGVGLGDVLRHERLRRALAAVANTSMRLSVVAQEQGYADQAHLNRDIRAAIGVAPGRYRALLRSSSQV